MQNFDDLFAPQPDQRGDASFDKAAWAAKKQANRENVYTMIDSYATEMRGTGDLFQSYLDVQARFDRYSVSNAILIAAQCPEATRLADFDSWKASGVYVKRGEDAITILEPGKEYIQVDPRLLKQAAEPESDAAEKHNFILLTEEELEEYITNHGGTAK